MLAGVVAASLVFAFALVALVDGWSIFTDFFTLLLGWTLAFVSLPAALAGIGLLFWLRRDAPLGLSNWQVFGRGALVGWLAALATSILVTLIFRLFFPMILIYAFLGMALGAIAGGMAAFKVHEDVRRAAQISS